jgi:hypothetical protein
VGKAKEPEDDVNIKEVSMKKHLIPLVLSASIVLSCTAYAAESVETESSGSNTITFRGFDWLSQRSDVEAALAAQSISDGAWMSNRHAIDWPEGSYSWVGRPHGDTSRLEDAGWDAMYSGVTAGGYAPSHTEVFYMYPVLSDGSLQTSAGNELLYLGVYEYDKDDFENLEAVFNDLTAKLSSLYGECTVKNDEDLNRHIWTDVEENKAILIYYADDKYPYVKLAYESGAADEMLGNLKSAIEKINADAQESERLANSSNTDGL